nr:phospholipase D-like domain-containing protein [uncultured Sediminibacterium sp.]
MQRFTDIQKEIISQIDICTRSLKIAVTWFTNRDIFDAIIRRIREANISVELIVLNDRINNKREGVPFQELINLNGKFYYSTSDAMVHHKFCIFDDQKVITGSYNWTYYAENRNWENIVTLTDIGVVTAYVEEFARVISAHTLVTDQSKSANQQMAINDLDYLQTDYLFQAKAEMGKGNELEVGKIYTQLLKINSNQPEIQKTRTEILSKYNNTELVVSPFEIGLNFQKGYEVVIPAFQKLPYTGIKNGTTAFDNQKAVKITVQKFDITSRTILELNLINIKSFIKGDCTIEHRLELLPNGVLTVYGKEIGGNQRAVSGWVNIKQFLPDYKKIS